VAQEYIASWAQRTGLGVPVDFGVSFKGARAEVLIKLAAGVLKLSWALREDCEAGPVEVVAEGLPPSAVPESAAQDFAAHLPALHVRAK
jgi:hypothetical protein